MKKVLNIVVAVISCFCILIATTVPAYAEGSSDELSFYENKQEVIFTDSNGDTLFTVDIDEFNLDDYLIPYDVYVNPPVMATMSLTSRSGGLGGFLSGLAWNSKYAAAGLTCTSGSFFMLGLGVAANMLVYGVKGLGETLRYDLPVVYFQTVTYIHSLLTEDCLTELNNMYTSWAAGEEIVVSETLSITIADIINGMTLADSAGNLIDTALSVQEAYIAGVFEGSMPSNIPLSSKNGYMQGRFSEGYKPAGFNDTFTCGNIIFSCLNSIITISNSTTGSVISIHADGFLPTSFAEQVRQVSKWFHVVNDPTCGPYWLCYSTTNNGTNVAHDAYPFVHANISATYPLSVSGTGTILDGLKIISVAWDTTVGTWLYTAESGETFHFPVEPITLLLSNTGSLTTGGKIVDTVEPSAGTYNPTYVPSIPYVGDATIGIPVTDTLVEDITVSTQDKVDTDQLQDGIDLGSAGNITSFLDNIVEFFDGIFDWLPSDFRHALDGVMVTLQTIILLMAAVKIIDILWP